MATEYPRAPARQGHVPAGMEGTQLGEALGGQAWNPHLGSAGRTQPPARAHLEWKLLNPMSESLGAARWKVHGGILGANPVFCAELKNAKALHRHTAVVLRW